MSSIRKQEHLSKQHPMSVNHFQLIINTNISKSSYIIYIIQFYSAAKKRTLVPDYRQLEFWQE